MGMWKLILPEAATNLVTNPSGETVTTGYTAIGGAVAAATTYARRGWRSIMFTPVAGVNDGGYYDPITLTNTVTYTFSVDFKGAAGIPYQIYFADGAGALHGTATTFTATGDWERHYVIWLCDGTAAYRLYFTKNNNASVAAYYIDGLQCCALAHDTTYIDGDQKGNLKHSYYWTGAPHASTSSRLAQERGGGYEVDLESTYYLKIKNPTGIGMPPAAHLTQDQPLLPGALYQGQKILPRYLEFAATFTTKSSTDLHYYRKDAIDALKADLVRDQQPVRLHYYGINTTKPAVFYGVYDAGMEFSSNTVIENPSIRFICYDPFVHEDGEGSAQLYTTQQVTDVYAGMKDRNTGLWSVISGTDFAGGEVRCMVWDEQRGRLYFGGAFTLVNGVANTVRVCYLDIATNTWTAMTTGITSAATSVYCMALAPNGDVWVGGDYTTCDGAACDGLAMWDYSANDWVVYDVCAGAKVYTLDIRSNGTLYVGGEYTDWNGDADQDYITSLVGAAWTDVGASPFSATEYPYCSGQFGDYLFYGTLSTGAAKPHIRRLTMSTNTWTDMVATDTAAKIIYDIEVDTNGDVYFVGDFSLINAVAYAMIAKLKSGTTILETVGGGITATSVRMIKKLKNGLFIIGGYNLTGGGGGAGDSMLYWNGSSYTPTEINLNGANRYILCAAEDNRRLYLGMSTDTYFLSCYANTINNTGTAITYPVIHYQRSAGANTPTMRWIHNATTGKTIFLNYELQLGEELVIDCRVDQRRVYSTYWGDRWNAMLRGSDFSEFYLLPGPNIIEVFNFANSCTLIEYITWPITHLSADGVSV